MRTTEQERQFLLERSTAIGGSDVQHLLDLPPYGCRRRLWYDKKGVPADFPFLGNRHTRRGQILEPFAIKEFMQGEAFTGQHLPWVVLPQKRHVGAHIDHILYKPKATEGPGVLEVKIPSVRNFYTLSAKGPSQASQLQLQWGIATAGANLKESVAWGVILVFNADLWRYRFWTYQRDEGMIEDLLKIADAFWPSLDSDRPKWERLNPQSRQCQDCPWRTRCQGITRVSPLPDEDQDEPTEPPAEDESFFDVVAAHVAATKVAADADAAKEAAKQAIVARLGGKPARVRCTAGTVHYTEVVTGATVEKPKPERRHMSLRVVPAKSAIAQGDEDYGDIETD